MTNVRIYHNGDVDEVGRHNSFVFGYQPGNPLVLVAEYEAEDTAAQLCEDAYRLFNVGDDPEFGTPNPIAVAYRERKNRSLSVGDVVGVSEGFFAVASAGFTPVDVRPGQVKHCTGSIYGTTALEGEPV